MVIGIVGSEAAKFTPVTEEIARQFIRDTLKYFTKVVSGGCHLGGIDSWAVEEAANLNIPFEEFKPRGLSWTYYKERNIQIAEASDYVICLTVKTLPPDYKIHGFEKFCYHCNTSEHIKSGGCWTVKYAKKMGKPCNIFVIE